MSERGKRTNGIGPGAVLGHLEQIASIPMLWDKHRFGQIDVYVAVKLAREVQPSLFVRRHPRRKTRNERHPPESQ
jgi:hypothetical protein